MRDRLFEIGTGYMLQGAGYMLQGAGYRLQGTRSHQRQHERLNGEMFVVSGDCRKMRSVPDIRRVRQHLWVILSHRGEW